MARIIEIDNDGIPVYVDAFVPPPKGSVEYSISITPKIQEAKEFSWVMAITICGYLEGKSGFKTKLLKKPVELEDAIN